MLSMFKDKKGFSSLFNKPGDEVGSAGASETSSRAVARAAQQQRCQRCWKNFSVGVGTPTTEYMCWRCEYPACRLCREGGSGRRPWTCCTCAQPKSLMKLFGKTRYGTDIVVHIMEYCDQRSERIMRSFFRAAAVKLDAARARPSGRVSAQRGSRGEEEGKGERRPARLSGGLRVQSPSNANQIHSQKSGALQRPAGSRRAGSRGSGKKSPKLEAAPPQAVTPVKGSGVVYPGPEDDLSESFCMPTIGTKDPDGVIEYSPSAKPYQQQQQQPALGHHYMEGTSPLAFKDGESEAEEEESLMRTSARLGAPAVEGAARRTMNTRPSAFEREAPATARTTAAAAMAGAESCEVSRSTLGARVSRTDGERASFGFGGDGVCDDEPEARLGTSPSPARSESPAPRFPTFAQFLDDQQTFAAQQQQLQQQQDYGKDRAYTQSGQTISVSPETVEEEPSQRVSGTTNPRRTSQRKSTGARPTAGRMSGSSRQRTTTGAARNSATPRRTGTSGVSGRLSHRSSQDPMSAQKKPRRSASGLLTPRGTGTGISGRRTTRASGSRRGDSTSYPHHTALSTPPLAPLIASAQMEQLSRTDGSGYDHSPSAYAAASAAGRAAGGSTGQRTPLPTGRSSNGGGSSAFARCATATRLSYGSAQERKVVSTRIGNQQRRPQSAVLTRTGSSHAGLFQRQNSRSGFGRTNSSANHLTRTASTHGYVRQPSGRTYLTGHTGTPGRSHPTPLTRTASNAGGARFGRTASNTGGNRFGRTASSNRYKGGTAASSGYARGGPSPHAARRPGGASPLTRTASSCHPFARQQTFGRTHTATQPFARSQSANAGLRVGRTATAVPSRLVRTRSTNATFGRTNTNPYGHPTTSGSRAGVGANGRGAPTSRPATPGAAASRFGYTPSRTGAPAAYGRRPTNTGASGGAYGRVGSTASPLLARGTPHRRTPATASPLISSSPLKRTNTAMGRSAAPAAGVSHRPAAAATATERARLVRTPTQPRFERQPTRPRTATPTATHKSAVEAAPVLVHMTRRRAAGATTPSAASSAQTTARSTGTTRRPTAGSGSTTASHASPSARPLLSSRNGTPKHTARTARSSVGGDAASLRSTDSPRSGLGGHAAAAATGKRRATPGAVRQATPSGNVFQRLNTGSRRPGLAHPSPKDSPMNRSGSKF